MVQNFHLPPMGFGPGSQPPAEDGQELEYMPMPQEMATYSPRLPEVTDAEALAPALAFLSRLADACDAAVAGRTASFDLGDLPGDAREIVLDTLGEGEVSARVHAIPAVAVQESVFAGVWVLKGAGIDRVEVAPVPAIARTRAFVARKPALGTLAPKPQGLANAPSVLVELIDRSTAYTDASDLHVINLSLLPHTEADLDWLDRALGRGSVEILSRGYGNCRVTATGQAFVWRVQFFNSMDALILDTFEVTDMPEVALAAAEDMADSAERIREVMEAIR